MPKLRSLSGREVVAIFRKFGFESVAQRGSHVKLRRLSSDGSKQTLTVPMHGELDRGTLRAIVRQAGHYIPEDDLVKEFYSS